MQVLSLHAFDDNMLFTVDSKVPAYVADEKTGAYVQTETNQFSLSYKELTFHVCKLNPDAAALIAIKQQMKAEDWIKVLAGAKMDVDFTFVKAGDKSKDGFEYQNTGYVKTIKSLTLSPSAVARINAFLAF